MQTTTNFLVVQGKRFHYVWLRDNCLCPQCCHPSSFQRLFDISQCTSPPEPLATELTDEKLIITWKNEDNHQSIFSISWLLDHAYDPEPESLYEPEILWDKAWIDANQPPSYDVQTTDPDLWMQQVSTLGFALLKNLKFEELDSFVSAIGPVHEYEYGRFDPLKSSDSGSDIAYLASNPLLPHTDATHRYDPRLVAFLYCVEHQAEGGESLVVDGFRVAEDFRRDHPDYFRILVENQVQFRHYNTEHRYFFHRITSILEVDDRDKVAGIHLSLKNCYRYLPFNKLEDYYEAYINFFHYLKNPDYHYCFRLESGDCLVYKNFRMLHGRTPFVPNSGSRHLELGFVGWHYFAGRRNYERLQHLYLGNSR